MCPQSLGGLTGSEWLAGAKIGALLLRSAPYGARKMQKQGPDFRKIRRLRFISLPVSPPKDWGINAAACTFRQR